MLRGRLHHIGIVVPSVRDALAAQMAMNGARLFAAATATDDGGALIAFVERPGEPLLELIEPIGEAPDLRDFLAKHPDGGLHHLCYECADIYTYRAYLAERGASFSSEVVMGVLGHPIFFISPDCAGGVLTEIIEVTAAA